MWDRTLSCSRRCSERTSSGKRFCKEMSWLRIKTSFELTRNRTIPFAHLFQGNPISKSVISSHFLLSDSPHCHQVLWNHTYTHVPNNWNSVQSSSEKQKCSSSKTLQWHLAEIPFHCSTVHHWNLENSQSLANLTYLQTHIVFPYLFLEQPVGRAVGVVKHPWKQLIIMLNFWIPTCIVAVWFKKVG